MDLFKSFINSDSSFISVKSINVKVYNFKILVCIGGSDPYFLNRYFLKLIANYKNRKKNKFLFVLGPLINKKESLILIKKIKKLNIKFLFNPQNIYELMSRSSLTITSTGITKYELAKIGVPSIIIAKHGKAHARNDPK